MNRPNQHAIRDADGNITYLYDVFLNEEGYLVKRLALHQRFRPVRKPWRSVWLFEDGTEEPVKVGDVDRFWPDRRRVSS